MRCSKCFDKAVINLKQYNLKLCPQHFKEFFAGRVEKTIKKYRLFNRNDLIIIAVSGGKDSLALWYVLNKLGYKTHGFHINLGISHNSYSDISEKKTRRFAEMHGLPLTVQYAVEEPGFSIDNYRKAGHRSACSTCGTVKRYLMNRFARQSAANILATGHNLDDEAAVLLGNVLNWQTGYLARQYPKLEASGDFFASRVKPFVELGEREIAAYSVLEGIDFVEDECPYSVGATTIFYKRILNQIEEKSPGTKLRFLRGFFENKHLFSDLEKDVKLISCEECGQPSVVSPCSYCRMKKRAHENV